MELKQVDLNDPLQLAALFECCTFGFRNMKEYVVDIRTILGLKNQLLEFNKCTEKDIFDIWENDQFDTENDAEYMASQFTKCFRSDPALFYGDCIVGEQKHLLAKFFKETTLQNMCRITEFMKWIKYSLGAYHIDKMFNDKNITETWRTTTSIAFFFGLSDEMQTKLVNNYNDYVTKNS